MTWPWAILGTSCWLSFNLASTEFKLTESFHAIFCTENAPKNSISLNSVATQRKLKLNRGKSGFKPQLFSLPTVQIRGLWVRFPLRSIRFFNLSMSVCHKKIFVRINIYHSDERDSTNNEVHCNSSLALWPNQNQSQYNMILYFLWHRLYLII